MSDTAQMSSEEALRKAKDMMGQSLWRSSSKDQVCPSCLHEKILTCSPTKRRAFYEHFLTLPKYPSAECRGFFGTMLIKIFADMEELQDSAVDSLLDLCEDEDEKVGCV
jgi:hypothetical protein